MPEVVPTPEVYKGFRFNSGVGLWRVVPLKGSSHAIGSAHAMPLEMVVPTLKVDWRIWLKLRLIIGQD